VKRSGLLSRLWPGRSRYVRGRSVRGRDVVVSQTAPGEAILLGLQSEVARLRVLGIAHAAAAASADQRARRAQEHVEALRDELGQTRAQLNAVREELLWAFAEGRLPVADSAVINLRVQGSRIA